jgi:hypothetical protein
LICRGKGGRRKSRPDGDEDNAEECKEKNADLDA